MTIQLVNPDGISKPESYSQVAVAMGTRTIYLSGQVALDARGQLVGAGDLAAQAEQAYLNVGAALAGVGAGFQDIARMNVYVVDWTQDKMEQLVAGALRAGESLGVDVRRAMTLIGVASLAAPEFLIEVEAIAVID